MHDLPWLTAKQRGWGRPIGPLQCRAWVTGGCSELHALPCLARSGTGAWASLCGW